MTEILVKVVHMAFSHLMRQATSVFPVLLDTFQMNSIKRGVGHVTMGPNQMKIKPSAFHVLQDFPRIHHIIIHVNHVRRGFIPIRTRDLFVFNVKEVGQRIPRRRPALPVPLDSTRTQIRLLACHVSLEHSLPQPPLLVASFVMPELLVMKQHPFAPHAQLDSSPIT